MQRETVVLLRCPLCHSDFHLDETGLRCASGHRFDRARQGYVNLLAGGRPAGPGDDVEMVAARLRFLGAGHYAPLAGRLRELVDKVQAPGAVVDIGCGTGYYLAETLGGQRWGLGLDVSVPAARRAARVHPRAGVVVADSWAGLPIRDRAAAVVLNVFAPRHPEEFVRILQPEGRLIVVTPTADHLAELVAPLGLLGVEEHKQDRLAESLAGRFTGVDSERLDVPLELTAEDVMALVAMGPSARHVPPSTLAGRMAELQPAQRTWAATASLWVHSYRPAG